VGSASKSLQTTQMGIVRLTKEQSMDCRSRFEDSEPRGILMFTRTNTRKMLDIGRELLAKGRRPECLRATFGLSLGMAVAAVSLITSSPAFGQNTTLPLFSQVGSKLVATGGSSLAATFQSHFLSRGWKSAGRWTLFTDFSSSWR
jgi:hypothetical protein